MDNLKGSIQLILIFLIIIALIIFIFLLLPQDFYLAYPVFPK